MASKVRLLSSVPTIEIRIGRLTGRAGARHEFLTVEHLLLAILDTPTVREVLEGCGTDPGQLAADRAPARCSGVA